jgi:hypothetical protein
MKYKTVNCGKCLQGRVVYEDIHPRAWVCPTCNQVHGVKWDKGFTELPDSEYAVPGYYAGEDEYDWDWMEYDKPNQVTS